MENKKTFLVQAEQTVGYNEAKDKESFSIGASVGIQMATNYYELEIQRLQSVKNLYKNAYNDTMKDIKGVMDFIKAYQDLEIKDE